jgi:zinc D-Ala-D-Ala dipeptidase
MVTTRGRFIKNFVLMTGSLLFFTGLTECSLMNVIKLDPGIHLDIRYATTNNFTGKAVYPFALCYLQEGAATALSAAQKEFVSLGYGLKVFDGYRPLSVQKIFWDLFPDENYVANPAKGSRHNRGCAVDLTLISLETGEEIPMGTEFDDFTEKAHRTCKDFSAEILANRTLLESMMTKYGFIGLPTEWWHFDFSGWEAFPILDISFEELLRTEESR